MPVDWSILFVQNQARFKLQDFMFFVRNHLQDSLPLCSRFNLEKISFTHFSGVRAGRWFVREYCHGMGCGQSLEYDAWQLKKLIARWFETLVAL